MPMNETQALVRLAEDAIVWSPQAVSLMMFLAFLGLCGTAFFIGWILGYLYKKDN